MMDINNRFCSKTPLFDTSSKGNSKGACGITIGKSRIFPVGSNKTGSLASPQRGRSSARWVEMTNCLVLEFNDIIISIT